MFNWHNLIFKIVQSSDEMAAVQDLRDRVYTEDLSHGQVVDRVSIFNPFR